MRNVVFVAPYFLDTTLRFVAAVASLDGVRLGLISREPEERLPDELRRRLAGHWRLDDPTNVVELSAGTRALARHLGSVERLLGVLEQIQEPLGAVRDALAIPGTSAEVARRFRDKALMKTELARAGLPCAVHRLARSAGEARDFAARVGYPLVVKPPAGAGAKSTHRLDDESDLGEALEIFGPSPAEPVLLEEFLRGAEHSFDSLSIDGERLWYSVSRYLPSPLEVLETPWIQWCVLLPRELDQAEYGDIRRAAFAALDVLGLETGLSHMEWFRRDDGRLAISEVAARPPGARITDLLSWCHDADFYRLWAQLMVWGEVELPERRWAVGAAYLRGLGRGQVAEIEGWSEVSAELGDLVVEARLPTIGQAAAEGYEGEGCVIVRHRETSTVEVALRRIVSGVRVVLSEDVAEGGA